MIFRVLYNHYLVFSMSVWILDDLEFLRVLLKVGVIVYSGVIVLLFVD